MLVLCIYDYCKTKVERSYSFTCRWMGRDCAKRSQTSIFRGEKTCGRRQRESLRGVVGSIRGDGRISGSKLPHSRVGEWARGEAWDFCRLSTFSVECLATVVGGATIRETERSRDENADSLFTPFDKEKEREMTRSKLFKGLCFALALGLGSYATARTKAGAGEDAPKRLLYVATPGIRDDLQYGGHGLLVFDIDNGHSFVKRIPTAGLRKDGKPDNVKGICASEITKRVYIGTTMTITCMDLTTNSILWEKPYEGGCDRAALSPDGKTLYAPSFEKDTWNVIDAISGEAIAKLTPKSGAHNTVYGLDGKEVYMAGLRSPFLSIADTSTHKIARQVGPFAAAIRPFTVNGAQTRCYVTVNGLLGFEIGDLKTGKKLARVEIPGYKAGPVKRHGCPSHGVGLTPDEKELWVVDGHNECVHIYEMNGDEPKKVETMKLRGEPGWVTFSIKGDYGYLSTGDVIDVKTRKIVAHLTDEKGGPVWSEKVLEIDFDGNTPVKTGNQFGLGHIMTNDKKKE